MSDRGASLEERIDRLESIEEIQQLKNTYHLYINDCRFDEFGSLFTEDAVVDMGYMGGESDSWRGRKHIAEQFKHIPEVLNQIKQFIHCHTVEVDGDRATGWALLEARYGSGEQSYNVAAKYEDAYRRVDGKWLFEAVYVRFYFTVPMGQSWCDEKRHFLIRRPDFGQGPIQTDLKPNPPV
ncbi:nuclear transport factor 2 family protein [Parasphingopyxis marina]|uniref:Nuclear transport factor 2 family protein n=1 Tax=Parasphingopyxis marina TaxID=2761622 RepID=A0A842HU80_9SPHN|nr:nuclear transport factor 2 family protein [Parasphingopyxis marina]MBC2776636.1 nuclear transport factor 2 family protein [Parasphingopyxis marina]